jgi:UDP-glucose 4-epimerase
MNILVTGGAGFIGSHITDKLIDLGHNVTIIDDLSSGKMESVNPNANFHKMDINDDNMTDFFSENKFDVVYHEAAQMNVRFSVEDPKFDASANILGSINLLEAARKTGVKKFIFASSGGAIYGEQDTFPADEEHAQKPMLSIWNCQTIS